MGTRTARGIAILGNSGSGKSTLCRRLAEAHGAAMLDLDTVAWEPGKIAVARDPAVAARDVQEFCRSHPRWIIEGCYEELVAAVLPLQPWLILHDPGLEQCQANCRARPWEPHKYASREEQDQRLEFLLRWVADYYVRDGAMSLRRHQALFDSYAGPKLHLRALPGEDFRLPDTA